MMNKQITITIIVLITCLLFFEISNIDIVLQDYFFDFKLKQWILDRDDRITKLLFYDGIKIIFYIFVLLMLIALIFFRNVRVIKEYKQGLIIVCLSSILVPLSVSVLKTTTNVPCPRNIERYGGNYPYVTMLSKYPETFHQAKNIRCYPAGHASGGFSLLSLFFLFKKRKNKIIALSSAMTIGWSIGTYKILIGDHFTGHTVITMVLAWLIILIIANSIHSLFNLHGMRQQLAN